MRRILRPGYLLWSLVIGMSVWMIYLGKSEIRWAFKVPREWRLNLRKDISAFMDWLVNTADFGLFSFYQLTRGIAWLLELPLNLVSGLIATGIMSGEGSAAVQLRSGR